MTIHPQGRDRHVPQNLRLKSQDRKDANETVVAGCD